MKMKAGRFAFTLVAAMISSRTMAFNFSGETLEIFGGKACFLDANGSVVDLVTNGSGPCPGISGTMDRVLGTGQLYVNAEVLTDNDMSADITLFEPGSYTWSYEVSDPLTGGSTTYAYSFTVHDGQLGAGMLFSWGNSGVRHPFGVVNVWDIAVGCADYPWDLGCMTYTSTDWDGDGVPGGYIQQGPITGMNMAIDFYASPVPIPAAVWLFGPGFLGLIGMARRKGRAA